MSSEQSKSSGTFTSSTFFQWCHDNIVFLFVHACAFGCMRRENGGGNTVSNLNIHVYFDDWLISIYHTSTAAHLGIISSMFACFPFHQLGNIGGRGGQEAEQSVQKMHHWQSQCERSEVNPEVSHNSTQELICSSTFLHRDFTLFRLDLTWLNTLSDWLRDVV